MRLYEFTIKQAAEKLKKGEATSVELTESVFERIDAVEPKIGAFITLCKGEAMEMAKASDERRKKGQALSDLDGIPMNFKDVFLTKRIKTTAASKILEDFIPIFDATSVKKLLDAGCVMIGKTNTDEFTMGSSTENSAFGPTHNPWDLSRVPGGSSGGSAASVAADESFYSLGTDTGGSIRQPASFCGTTGLKVTYGLVSRYGVVSYASSFDTIGPITKTAEDAAIVLSHIAGNDSRDSTSVQRDLPDYFKALNKDIKGKKIGIPLEFYGKGLDAGVAKVLEQAKKEFESLGAIVEDTSLPLTKYAIAAYYILVKSEASSNLSRYDGIRYGLSTIKKQEISNPSTSLRAGNNQTLEEVYFKSRTEGFGPEAKRSIMLGAYTLSAGYFDAYYKKAAKVRTKIREEYDNLFKKYDALLTPVSPFPAFKIGEKVDDPLSMYLSDVNTVPINIAGVPALSIPAGFVERGGKKLPVGMQLIGPMWGEQALLNIGYAFQEATDYHLQRPKII